MTEQRLLSSYEVFSPEVISEDIEIGGMKQKKMILKGILQRSDSLNQNGRIYPRSILEREIRNYQKFILENRSLGECDHPDSSVIELKNVSHLVRSAEMDEKGIVHGSIEVLNTPCGKILQTLVESGVKLGISSRGVGSTKKQGDNQVVQNDFILICFDAVVDPSTPNAFLLPEGKRISQKEIDQVFNRSDRINRIMNDILNNWYNKITPVTF